MSRTSWWTEVSPDELRALHARVMQAVNRQFTNRTEVDREEVVQHAFVDLFRNRERISSDDDGLYRYLVRAATSAALDRIKQAKARSTRRAPASAGGAPPAIPVDVAAAREKNRKIRDVFRELDEVDRLILWYHAVEGRSVRSVAADLDMSWHRVADTIERVKWTLRRRLGD